ncbi:hypothetical protein MIND_01368300 [Mycena indigotica]|uniref:DUF6534 domain-containing protein n=1 Tax=Mycena indigotica TaxID=2126181 RepID=A0A8H6RZQ6_9AGAR|nr:uncharacterized protein MIND_01368300 [Mycena indigotica]KAF7289933.1 hypothetical protein MIND_01368300 [Mycena indigotica]
MSTEPSTTGPPMPPPGGLVPLPPNIGDITASALMGSLLNYMLYGVLAVQVYVYRLNFPNDKNTIKALVYGIFIVETVLTALNGVDVYHWFAAGFGDIIEFSKPLISPAYTPIFGSIIAVIVQCFFCYRIYIIKRQAWPLCIFIGLVSFMQAAGGMGGGISAYLSANQVHDHNRIIFVYLWLVGDVIADVLIAGTMTYLLLKAGQQQHKQTNDIVKRIVRLTIETNTASTVLAILSLVLFYGRPNTTYFIAPTMVLAKLYANTLLVTFNNRAFIHSSNNTSHGASMSDTYQSRSRSGARKSLPFSAGLGLRTDETESTFAGTYSTGKVTVTTHSMVDGGYNSYNNAYDMNRMDEEAAKRVPL